MTVEHPLQWPDGWPRTPAHERSAGYQFTQAEDGAKRSVTLDVAQRKLFAELARLRAADVVLSMSRPSTGQTSAREPGVALYFTIRGRQMVMASDRFATRAANARSLGLAIEAMRQLERHGGGAMVERAFRGFAALPPPRTCWQILELAAGAEADDIRAAFRRKAQESGAGGNVDMGELVRARDEALKGAAA